MTGLYQPVSRPVPRWLWVVVIVLAMLCAGAVWTVQTDNMRKGDRIDTLMQWRTQDQALAQAERKEAQAQRDAMLASQRKTLRLVKAQELRLARILDYLREIGVDLPDRLLVGSTKSGAPPKA